MALDAVIGSKAELATTLAELTVAKPGLTGGLAPDAGDPLFPPPESGIVGPTVGPSDLTITVGFGASLFDGRFGLADRIPRQLVRMPDFRNDRIQAALAHGDLLLQICATDEASCIHALRYLMLGTRGSLVVRWLIHGFQQRPGGTVEHGGTPATRRNLLGFKDGTANPLAGRPRADGRARLGRPGPGRAGLGGRGHATWSRGRSACSSSAGTAPRSASRRRSSVGPSGPARPSARRARTTIRPTATIRTATRDPARRPYPARQPADARRPQANRILRRGYSYSRGFDDAGLLDEGLFFVAFQRDLERGFVTVQNRLAGEPLEEYIQPVGGGYFFAPPGTQRAGRRLGRVAARLTAGARPADAAGQAGARPEAPVGPDATGDGLPPHTNRIRTGTR